MFEVLAYLVRHRDRVVPRTELLDEIWGSRFVTDSALASRVKAARKAVGDSGREQGVIRTVHGRGYQFLAPVQEGAGPERSLRWRAWPRSGGRPSWSGWAGCTASPRRDGASSCS